MAVLQDAEFRGLSVVYQGESSFTQIQYSGFKELNRAVVENRAVPIQFNKPHLSCRRMDKVVLIYLPATYESYSKVEL